MWPHPTCPRPGDDRRPLARTAHDGRQGPRRNPCPSGSLRAPRRQVRMRERGLARVATRTYAEHVIGRPRDVVRPRRALGAEPGAAGLRTGAGLGLRAGIGQVRSVPGSGTSPSRRHEGPALRHVLGPLPSSPGGQAPWQVHARVYRSRSVALDTCGEIRAQYSPGLFQGALPHPTMASAGRAPNGRSP